MDYLKGNLALTRDSFVKSQIENASRPNDRMMIETDKHVISYKYKDNERWKGVTSVYDPALEARQQLSKVEDWNVNLFFVVGEAGFYHVEEILKRVSEKTLVVFVSKNPNYLRFLYETRNLRSILGDRRFMMVVSESMETIKTIVQKVIHAYTSKFPTFSFFAHPIESKIQSDFITDFEKFLMWTFKTIFVNFNTTAQYESFWAKNFIYNTPHILSGASVSSLQNKWFEKPVIIVGAGPSLNKNIDLLKEANGRAMILCVDSAYRILKRNGIEPDFLVSVDGTPENAKHLRGIDYANVPMLIDRYANSHVLAKHKGIKVFTDSIGFHRKWLEQMYKTYDETSLPSGGSVSTIAFSFARYMGANPVVMIGTDLSYPEGKYYASGSLKSNETIEDIKKHRDLIELEDIYGHRVFTTSDYHYYLQWFEEQSERNDRTYINATEGGALKGRFLVKTLRETLDGYTAEDIQEEKVRFFEALKNTDIRVEEKEKFLKMLKKSRSECMALVRYTTVLIKLLHELSTLIEQGNYENHSTYLKRIPVVNERISGLHLALSFLNGHSLETILKDKFIESALEDERGKYDQRQITLLSARRAMNLFIDFHSLAIQSLEMHRMAIGYTRLIWGI